MSALQKPPAGTLRIGGGNVYVANPEPRRAVQIAAETHSHSWGWSEGSKMPTYMDELDKYDGLSAHGFDDPRDANDCSMMVRKDVSVLHTSFTQVCRDRQPEKKIDQTRTFAMLAYRAPGFESPVCHIAIHPNWVAGIDDPNHPAVEEYVRSVYALADMIRFARSMGWLPVVSGDFNLRENAEKRYLTTFDVFFDYSMGCKMEGIDGVAWDKRLKLVDWETIPKSATKSDHDFWTVADFRLAGAS